jgi:hypothetical protein
MLFVNIIESEPGKSWERMQTPRNSRNYIVRTSIVLVLSVATTRFGPGKSSSDAVLYVSLAMATDKFGNKKWARKMTRIGTLA